MRAEKAPIICLRFFINKKSCHSFCVGYVSRHCSLLCPVSSFIHFASLRFRAFTSYTHLSLHFSYIHFSTLQSIGCYSLCSPALSLRLRGCHGFCLHCLHSIPPLLYKNKNTRQPLVYSAHMGLLSFGLCLILQPSCLLPT